MKIAFLNHWAARQIPVFGAVWGLMSFHLYNLFFNNARTEIVYPLIFIIAVCLVARKKIPLSFWIDPISLSLFAFLLIAGLSNIVNGLPFDKLTQVIWFFFPYFWGKYLIADGKMKIEYFFKLFIGFATAFALLFVAGHYGLGIEGLAGKNFIRDDGRLVFTFYHPVRVGLYLGTALLFCVYYLAREEVFSWKKNAVYLLDMYVLIPICLLKSQDRTSFLALSGFVFGQTMAFKKLKLIVPIVIAGIIMVFAFNLSGRMIVSSDSFTKSPAMLWRYSFWEVATRLFIQKPILGNGYSSFKEQYRPYVATHIDELYFKDIDPVQEGTHNLNLSLLAETGLLGWAAMNCVFVFAIWGFWKYRRIRPELFTAMLTVAFYYLVMQLNVFTHSHHSNKVIFLVIGLVGGGLYPASLKNESDKI